MSLYRQEMGALGERLAKEYLIKKGYFIMATNYRCPLGEVDIIGKKESVLVFIEVKTRSTLDFGYPIEAINRQKTKRLKRVAEFYLGTHKTGNWDIRLDSVEVLVNHTENIE